VPIGAKQNVPITVQYDQGSPGDPVAIQVLDGGGLNGNQMAQSAKLDGTRSVNFVFQAGTQDGVYRVNLFNGNSNKTLFFWVGPQPALRQAVGVN